LNHFCAHLNQQPSRGAIAPYPPASGLARRVGLPLRGGKQAVVMASRAKNSFGL
jgi:hypothetical protein